MTYQWFKDGKAVEGATQTKLTFSAVAADDIGSYHFEATNIAGTTTSDTIALALHDLPVVTSTSASQSLLTGESTSLSSSANGDGITVLWHKDGQVIADATSHELLLENLTPLDNGVYRLQFINAATQLLKTDVFSAPIVITVNDPPAILAQPTGTALSDGTANLFVTATGSGTLSYQWYKDGKPAKDGNAPTLTVNKTGSYTVTVTSDYGSVTSKKATVSEETGNGNIAIHPPRTVPAPTPRPTFPGLPGYQAWASTLPIELSGTHDDPDRDGRLNLLEYALGSEPQQVDSSPTLKQQLIGDTLLLTYNLSKTAHDLNFRIESSYDLHTWEPAKIESTSQIDMGTVTRVTEQINVQDSRGSFYRLVVEER